MQELSVLVTSVLRFIFPVLIITILLRCIISLFRNRPRLHRMAQIVNLKTNEIIDIDRWETSIGKSRSNDIIIQHQSVSRFHAVLSKKRKGWMITDTFSKSGVALNGNHIDQKAVLQDGDIIKIGNFDFKFICSDAISDEVKENIRKQTSLNERAYGVLVDVKTRRPVYLKNRDVLIGRATQCDIKISSEMVSSQHARIHLTSRGWALSDLNSHNGTRLNGRIISEPQLIFDNDIITFGDRVFIFYDK